MTRDEVMRRLRADVDRRFGGNQAEWSRSFGKTRAFGSAVLKGKREPSAEMLAAVGVRKTVRKLKVIIYEEIGNDAPHD